MLTRLTTVWFVAGACVLLATAQATASPSLSASDLHAGRAAFAAAAKGEWDTARRSAAGIADPVAAKLVFWSDVTRLGGRASFAEITRFIAENPDWPDQAVLRRRAEEAINGALPPTEILAWFQDRHPITTEGRVRLGEAQLATGRSEAGRATIRDAWIRGTFQNDAERAFLATHGARLTGDDHRRRLDRLLWQGRHTEAQRMLGRVDAGTRALAEARIRLRAAAPGVDGALARVPAASRNDPGLIYERVRWRRQKGQDSAARELLRAHPLDHANPELWWTERAVLARRALAEGHVSEAYRTAKDHALSEGASFADAEWLAGWIALRFLDDAKPAFDHFVALFKGVRFPVSRSRGAYWAARAAEADLRADMAEMWYRTAAEYPTTYYGQLAAIRLGSGSRLSLPPDPHPRADEIARFNGHDLVRAVRLLAAFDRPDLLPPFLLALAEIEESAGWKALAAELAGELGRADTAIAIAKEALRRGHPLIGRGYPAVRVPEVEALRPRAAEIPLILAMVRQESAFDPQAVSRAGARGLLQVMPDTARGVASKLNIPYSKTRLTGDPDYNLKIGRAYMTELLDSFNGSYVLALAAYNAGPGRVRQWRLANGDPGGDVIDAVDWIEAIPFAETRNYVQRTLENLQVYRTMLDGTEVAWTLDRDLKR